MADKVYTWYVNLTGDVQVYEGHVNERNLINVANEREAMKAHIENIVELKRVPKGIRGLFNPDKHYDYDYIYKKTQVREPIKYFIPQQYAKAFFILIGSPAYYMGETGVTDIDVSEFLDD